jgi:hypothetical protein
MARYDRAIPLGREGEVVAAEVVQYLKDEGFRLVRYKGKEAVYQKGSGLLVAPQYIKVTYREREAIIEAWMRYVLLPKLYVGELDLDCMTPFTGTATVKPKLRARIARIEEILAQVND